MGLTVYILRCSDQSYYTGVSRDAEKRVRIHNEGWDPLGYTCEKRPVELVWANHFQSNTEAIEWEKKIKGWSRKKKEALIEGRFDKLPELAECKNISHWKNYKGKLGV